jgi:DNA-binding FadR family transcriptional regulator
MNKAQEHMDLTNMMSSDLAFHRAIWRFSDNVPLERALRLVCASLFTFYLIRFSPTDVTRHAHDFDQDFEEHREMLGVLKEGNPEYVKRRFREILNVFRLRHLEHVQEALDKELSAASKERHNGIDSIVQQSPSE